MKRLNAMGQASLAEGELSVKVKELIALSIAITMKCKGCIVHHAKALGIRSALRVRKLAK